MAILTSFAIVPASSPEATESDLDERIKQFLAAKRIDGLSAKTLKNYRGFLNLFAKRTGKPVSKIKTDDIRGYLAYLLDERHLKEGSVQTHINTLRSFFGWLAIEGMLRRNPMLKIRSFKIDKKHSRTALTPEELERLREACGSYREKAILEFFASSGCRLSEAAGIAYEAVNMRERCVMVHGKGNKDRVIYFSVRARYMIEEYVKTRKGETTLFSNIQVPYLPMKPRSIEKIIQQLGERAHLTRRIYPHLLRHTFAVEALNRGMDITVIQQLLGHEDVSTTQIYASISQEAVRHQYGKFMA